MPPMPIHAVYATLADAAARRHFAELPPQMRRLFTLYADTLLPLPLLFAIFAAFRG